MLQKKNECLEMMLTDNFGNEAQSERSQVSHSRTSSQTMRSNSYGIQPSSDSLDFSSMCPLTSFNSFSGSTQRSAVDTPEEDFFCPFGRSEPSDSPSVDNTEATAEVEVAVELEKTPLFLYLTDMLMDEKVEEKKCMFVEMSAYQAMAKELGDLISYDPSYSSMPGAENTNSEFHFEDNSGLFEKEYLEFQGEEDVVEDVGHVDSWINEILSGPLPPELRDSPDSETKHGHKHAESPEESCSNADSEFCSCNTLKDEDFEVAQHHWAYVQANGSYLDSSSSLLDSVNSAHSLQNKNGRMLPVGFTNPISSSNGNEVHVTPVDLTNLLIRCAHAVEQGNFGYANELINELREHSSAYGNGRQRMAHYFVEALVAKMSGTGGQLYSALSNNRPSEAQMLKALMLFCEHCPFIQVPHIFANHSIVEAFKGASRVHIIDYGILYGVQWPCLLYQLSTRPEGPPHLRITGIDRPQPGFRPSARIQDTGRRLAKLAKKMGVPFKFHAIAEKWEAITPAHLLLREDEVLAVNCMFRFRHLLDESVTAASPRNLVLSRIKSLNPKVFVQGVFNAGYNAPFFMSRFREALSHFSTIFDAMESSFPPDHVDRQLIDHEIVGREILNVVACEGLERVERTETYRQWQARTTRAGFQQIPSSGETMAKIKMAMRVYHRDYGVGHDGHWFLIGWKNHITHAMTIWEPIRDGSP